MGKLLQVGFKLAVLGVDPGAPNGFWHIVKPGSYNVPTFRNGDTLTMARSLCGRYVASNGYASDVTPPAHQRCPGCWEQL